MLQRSTFWAAGSGGEPVHDMFSRSIVAFSLKISRCSETSNMILKADIWLCFHCCFLGPESGQTHDQRLWWWLVFESVNLETSEDANVSSTCTYISVKLGKKNTWKTVFCIWRSILNIRIKTWHVHRIKHFNSTTKKKGRRRIQCPLKELQM